jgi:hypothetical protein
VNPIGGLARELHKSQMVIELIFYNGRTIRRLMIIVYTDVLCFGFVVDGMGCPIFAQNQTNSLIPILFLKTGVDFYQGEMNQNQLVLLSYCPHNLWIFVVEMRHSDHSSQTQTCWTFEPKRFETIL